METSSALKRNGVIAFDLDGTLAEYTAFTGPTKIGAPIESMVTLVKWYLKNKFTVIIFTARLSFEHSMEDRISSELAIREWTKQHIGTELKATANKNIDIIKIYDDRAVGVVSNNGIIIGETEDDRKRLLG